MRYKIIIFRFIIAFIKFLEYNIFMKRGVMHMIYTKDEIRRRVTPIAEKYNLRTIYIFGSYARNEATEDSDVDILIDRKGSKVSGMVIGGLYNDLSESIGKKIDLVTTCALEQKSTKERTPGFIDNINADKVKIYG